jgi:DNA-binding transcriptional regulator LsrR (DeoR family)
MALFDRLTIALVGIGGLKPSGLLASSGNVFSAEELATVRAAGGVGDIGLRYLRADGHPVETPLHDRVIGIELEQLRRVPRAIGVAGGTSKTAAIRAAMLGGWINCLVTDRLTAERLLELEPEAAEPEPVSRQRPGGQGPGRPRREGRLVGVDVR